MTMRKLRSVFVKKNHRGALTAHKTMGNDERTAALRSRLLLAAQKTPDTIFRQLRSSVFGWTEPMVGLMRDLYGRNTGVSGSATVQREGLGRVSVPAQELVYGDVLYLAKGDRVPADVRILECEDFAVDESALRGKGAPAPKEGKTLPYNSGSDPLDCGNLAFRGDIVVSGSALCLVVGVGENTLLANSAKAGYTGRPVYQYQA